jgi:hypothetical protein
VDKVGMKGGRHSRHVIASSIQFDHALALGTSAPTFLGCELKDLVDGLLVFCCAGSSMRSLFASTACWSVADRTKDAFVVSRGIRWQDELGALPVCTVSSMKSANFDGSWFVCFLLFLTQQGFDSAERDNLSVTARWEE